MDQEEFEKYLFIGIFPLFPDALDIPGKWFLIKLDIGPRRMNPQLMAHLCLLGFYTYPSVPNTTAVTQETDQKYSCFKTKFCSNSAGAVHIVAL